MLGWDLGDILQYVFLCGGLIIIGLAGRPGSIVFRMFFKKDQLPNEKTLRLLRRLSVIGLVILVSCAIASRIIYLIQGK